MADKSEQIADDMFELFSSFEDIQAVAQGNQSKNENVKTMTDMIATITKKLDLSNAKPAEEENMMDAINRRVGEAYGVYIKVLGIANRDKDTHKDIADLHGELEDVGVDFKQLVSDLNELQ